MPYTQPKLKLSAFHCPICNAYAKQDWGQACCVMQYHSSMKDTVFGICSHCGNSSIWHRGIMVYPFFSYAPFPNQDLPEDIKYDFEEARSIINRSPRGAAALLRLCIQKLCAFLGESGKNINNDIASLVKKGLNPKIQKSLDIVRVIGNEAIHPGILDIKDNQEIAEQLCKIINIISDTMITQPKMIDNMYQVLPEEKRTQIDHRDKIKYFNGEENE